MLISRPPGIPIVSRVFVALERLDHLLADERRLGLLGLLRRRRRGLGRRRLGRGREPRLRVEVVLVEQQLPERVVQEPAVAPVFSILVLT